MSAEQTPESSAPRCSGCGGPWCWDRETGKHICLLCEVNEIDALEAMFAGGPS